MTFHVGQKLVCVDDSNWPLDQDPYVGEIPVRDSVYTVRDVHVTWWGTLGLLLQEVVNPPDPAYEAGERGFRAVRFRPVVTTDISIFTAMLKEKQREYEPTT